MDTRTWTVAATLGGFTLPYRLDISRNGTLTVVVDLVDRRILREYGVQAAPDGVAVWLQP